jgi:hypothetical protein
VRSYKREKRYVRKDGSIICTNLSLSVAYGADGRPMHVISIVEDIHARKVAEQKVERLMRFYTALTRTNEAIVRIWAGDRVGEGAVFRFSLPPDIHGP